MSKTKVQVGNLSLSRITLRHPRLVVPPLLACTIPPQNSRFLLSYNVVDEDMCLLSFFLLCHCAMLALMFLQVLFKEGAPSCTLWSDKQCVHLAL